VIYVLAVNSHIEMNKVQLGKEKRKRTMDKSRKCWVIAHWEYIFGASQEGCDVT
jgi:hypothetical protein